MNGPKHGSPKPAAESTLTPARAAEVEGRNKELAALVLDLMKHCPASHAIIQKHLEASLYKRPLVAGAEVAPADGIAVPSEGRSPASVKRYGESAEDGDFGSRMHVDSPRLSFEIASGILTDAEGNQRPVSAAEEVITKAQKADERAPLPAADDTLPDCGGFALDRPATLDELQHAVTARFKVAVGKSPELGIENFTFYHTWMKDESKKAEVEKCLQEGRIITYVQPGDNEGYLVQILVAPRYLDNGPAIPVAHSKCWSREGAMALLSETSELMLRW